MANQNMIETISKRLNIEDSSSSTRKKCEQFLRVLQSKSSLKLSDQVKTVICLDIASTFSGSAFDKETALQLCSLKKSAYENNLNNIKKILDLDKPLSISELCVQFSCTHLKDTAETLYLNYKKRDNKIKDITHPQYVAAAVYTVCKLNNLKLSKSQFTSISRLKTSQWNTLTNDFETFAKSMGLERINIKEKIKNNSEIILDDLDTISEDNEIKKESGKKLVIEDYEVWKNRILQEAEQAIRDGKD